MQKQAGFTEQMSAIDQFVKEAEEERRREHEFEQAKANNKLMGGLGQAFSTPSRTAVEIMAGTQPTRQASVASPFDQGRKSQMNDILAKYQAQKARGNLLTQYDQMKNQSDIAQNKLAWEKEKFNRKQDQDMKLAQMEQKADPSKAMALTKGEEAVDRAFAKDYVDWKAKGGFADVKKQLTQLDEVSKKLDTTDTATGPVVGNIPKGIRDILTPEGADMQDAVEEVVQRNLRAVLGAQFTEREGTRLIQRAYNPRLSEQENKKRIKRLINQIAEAAKSKQEAAEYFEQNGTLKGFDGKLFNSANEFLADIDTSPYKEKPQSGAAYADTTTKRASGSWGTNLKPQDIDNMSEAELDEQLKLLGY